MGGRAPFGLSAKGVASNAPPIIALSRAARGLPINQSDLTLGVQVIFGKIFRPVKPTGIPTV